MLLHDLEKFVRSQENTGVGMRKLQNPKILEKFYPNWNANGAVTLKVGDIVSMISKFDAKSEYQNGEVKKVNKSRAIVQFPDNKVQSSVPCYLLRVVGTADEKPKPAAKAPVAKKKAAKAGKSGNGSLESRTYQDLAKLYQETTGDSFIGKNKATLIQLLSK